MKTALTACLALFLAGCTGFMQIAQDAREKEMAEQQKRRNRETICFDGGAVKSLNLFYNTYTFGAGALPSLKPDLLRKIAEKTGRFRDSPELVEALSGPVNEAFNSRLAQLNDGTYNTAFLRIGVTGYLGITPAVWLNEEFAAGLHVENPAAVVFVWVPESIGRAVVRDMLSDTELDALWVFDAEGNLVGTRESGWGITLGGDRPELSSAFGDVVAAPHTRKCSTRWSRQ